MPTNAQFKPWQALADAAVEARIRLAEDYHRGGQWRDCREGNIGRLLDAALEDIEQDGSGLSGVTLVRCPELMDFSGRLCDDAAAYFVNGVLYCEKHARRRVEETH